VRWEGLIMFSKQKHTKGYAIVPPLLCMNQEYISALKSERLPLCWCALLLFTNLTAQQSISNTGLIFRGIFNI
jgi:hypothetical protein